MEQVNKKILLVEDDPNFGTVLRDYLIMNDYDVVHAKNGMEGFEKFKKDTPLLFVSSNFILMTFFLRCHLKSLLNFCQENKNNSEDFMSCLSHLKII